MRDVNRINEAIKQAETVREHSDDHGTIRRLNQAMESLRAARRRLSGFDPGDRAADVEPGPEETDASAGWREEYHRQGVDRDR